MAAQTASVAANVLETAIIVTVRVVQDNDYEVMTKATTAVVGIIIRHLIIIIIIIILFWWVICESY
jgi:hypothetical protein